LFRHAFSDLEEVRHLLGVLLSPAMVKALSWEDLKVEKGDSVDETLREFRTDILFSGASTDEVPVKLALLLEHQSTVDAKMPCRIHAYASRFWAEWQAREGSHRIPLLVPIVLYTGDRRWTAGTDLGAQLALSPQVEAAFSEYIPRQPFIVFDLSQLKDVEARAMTVFGLLCLRFLGEDFRGPDALKRLEKHLPELRALWGKERGEARLSALMTYFVSVANVQTQDLKPLLTQVSAGLGEDFMNTLAARLIEQGREEGRKEGREEGRKEGRKEGREKGREEALKGSKLLMRIGLKLRLSTFPEEIEARVLAAGEVELQRWTKRVDTAESLDDIFT
jgi:predicted transposase/invertase (TIGR01784 family)